MALAVMLYAVPAVAQEAPAAEPRWLVIPAVAAPQGEPMHPARAAARLLGEELRAHGTRALSIEEAKALFEQQGSAPPMTASAADIDELARDAQRALYHVASGLPQRAKQDVQRALERARRALESLNRETRAAQHLLDACLFLVRAHLQHGNRSAARNQALECRRLVPDILPDGTMHPPDVIGVFAEAQAELLSHEPAALRIESEPTGCAAYVNGRNLGPTPRELSQLSPGEYRLQVECDPGLMGRVHRVSLTNRRVVVKIDTRYDRAIETLFDLSLGYGSRSLVKDYSGRDAVETARIVGANNVVVATEVSTESETPARVQLERYRVSDGVPLARATVDVSRSGEIERSALDRARVALITAKNVPIAARANAPVPSTAREDAPAQVPAPAPSVEVTASPVTGEPDSRPLDLGEPEDLPEQTPVWPIVGYALAGVGGASLITGWALYGNALSEQQDYADALNANPDPGAPTTEELTAVRDTDNAEAPPLIAAAAGSVLTTASLPLWLPRTRGIPWWGWASGAAGLALGTAGAVLAVGESDCAVDRFMRCTEPAHATHLGPMLMLQAAPLLALPIVQGVRALGGESLHFQLGTRGQRDVMVRIEGQL